MALRIETRRLKRCIVLSLSYLWPPAGTSGRCTWASCHVGRRSTSGAGTGPWCSNTQTSTCCGCWRLSWSLHLSWSCSSASWSRRTEPRRCSVGGARITPAGLTSVLQTAARGVCKAKETTSIWKLQTSCHIYKHNTMFSCSPQSTYKATAAQTVISNLHTSCSVICGCRWCCVWFFHCFLFR